MQKTKILFLSLLIVAIAFSIGCSTESKTLNLSPSSLNFGDIYLGDFQKLDVVLTNKYGRDLLITNLVFSNTTIFTFTSGNTLPLNLVKNNSHTLSIQLTPIAGGQINETLSIVHDASSKARMLNLTGNGVPAARMQINEKSNDFKIVRINTDKSFDFEISNIGTADMNINNLSFLGAGAVAYSIVAGGTLPIIIPVSSSHKISVQFKPTADIVYNADLSITHDAINETSPLVLTLTGEGTILNPEILLNQTSPWDFGTVATTLPSMQNLEIENTGSDDLTVTSLTFTIGTIFSVDSIENTTGNAVNLPAVVSPGEKIIAKIKFSPTATTVYNDTLSIVHDGTNETSPLLLSITGTGKLEVTRTFTMTKQIVNWTVPAGVTSIRIEAWGGKGGGTSGGKGARVRGDFTVTPGETLKIIVAETGYVTAQGPRYGAGGGGGSFVYRNATDLLPMLIAAGGGGQSEYNYSTSANGGDGSGTQTATPGAGTGSGNGGTGGNGGAGGRNVSRYSTGGGGCGWLTDGHNGLLLRNPEGKGGECPLNGAAGGIFTHSPSYCVGNAGDGGFGGGGGMSDNTGAGGGGGGYNGGGGGNNYMGSGQWGSGGGGGSYNGGTNPSNSSGVRTTHGEVKITY
ncbi:MAG: choice-of-anchor D domain-containing protein [Planctomycetes bacterium]|nr:choice-of-anchor D domain-containing protein [Planctomycetota bacterium]